VNAKMRERSGAHEKSNAHDRVEELVFVLSCSED